MPKSLFIPNSCEARDLASHLHAFSSLSGLRDNGPVILSKGQGVYVWDNRGRKYLEGNSGLWNAILGFSHQGLQDVVAEQTRNLPTYHTFFGRASEPTVQLAQKLTEIAPVPMSKAYFTNSGSEANDTAVKMLWFINRQLGRPESRKIISQKGAYHGVTGLAASLTARDYNKVFGLPLDGFLSVEAPHYWRNGQDGETEEEFVARLARQLDQLIRDEGPETIAGFFAEPVMGAGGVIVPPKAYFPKIQAVLEEYGIPLCADEVICGFGRSGKFWGSLTFDIKPDIIIASKCLSAGYFPIGAVLISPRLEEKLMQAAAGVDEFPHGFTCGGHPVACAVANKAIDIIMNEGVYDHMLAVAPLFNKYMQEYAGHPKIGQVRSVGLMGALEVVADKSTNAPFPAETRISDRIAETALKNGLICRPIGASVVLAPPFIITDEELQELFEKLHATMAEVLPS